jgi:DNA invertase Pin-like site-specific DNA recombinase
MRVAIYARFSSDLQDARSIADQIGAARDHAERQGWQVVGEFCDAAISARRCTIGQVCWICWSPSSNDSSTPC